MKVMYFLLHSIILRTALENKQYGHYSHDEQ
jgi:hypothetical protein